MTTVLDTPMAADRVSKRLHAYCQTADVVTCLRRFFAVANTHRAYHADRLQTFPQFQSRQILWDRHLSVNANFFPAMTFFLGAVPTRLGVGKVALALFLDVVDDLLMQRLLVPFQ